MTTRNRVVLRSFWVQVHLWLGLTLGVVGALLGLSGSILVYDHEVDAWLNPARYAISGPQVALPLSEYAQRAEAGARPTARVRRTFAFRTATAGPSSCSPARAATRAAFQRVYLDPPTGRVLDAGAGP